MPGGLRGRWGCGAQAQPADAGRAGAQRGQPAGPAHCRRTPAAGVAMVANFSHTPNAEGLRWFYRQVWPVISAKLPGSRLLLAGKDSEQLQALTAGDTTVEWLGVVPDLGELYRRSACVVVPVLSGGGTRLKLLEAMAWAVPLVTTTAGASGVEHQGSVAVADDPLEFANCVEERLRAPGDFQEQAARARQVVAERYTWDQIGRKLVEILEAV